MCSKCFTAKVEIQLEGKVKILRTNRAREYISDMVKEFCEEKGITRQLTIPHTLQQNGVAEFMNWTLPDLVNMVRANH